MIEYTRCFEPEYPGQWRPGVILTDDRCHYFRAPYAKLLKHPAKLDHELPWRGLVVSGRRETRGHFSTAHKAFRWASGLLRANITGGRYGIYGEWL